MKACVSTETPFAFPSRMGNQRPFSAGTPSVSLLCANLAGLVRVKCLEGVDKMDNTTLLIVILLVLILFGGGFYGRGRWW